MCKCPPYLPGCGWLEQASLVLKTTSHILFPTCLLPPSHGKEMTFAGCAEFTCWPESAKSVTAEFHVWRTLSFSGMLNNLVGKWIEHFLFRFLQIHLKGNLSSFPLCDKLGGQSFSSLCIFCSPPAPRPYLLSNINSSHSISLLSEWAHHIEQTF